MQYSNRTLTSMLSKLSGLAPVNIWHLSLFRQITGGIAELVCYWMLYQDIYKRMQETHTLLHICAN